MRRADFAACGYFVLLIVKALYPAFRVPVRHYDMFSYPLPAQRVRSVMVFHHDDRTTRAVPAAFVLPFEPSRNTSILRTAVQDGPSAVREIGMTSLRWQRRGWRAFDQVWGPPRPSVKRTRAVCIHVVPADELGALADADHTDCRIPLPGAEW